MLSTYCILLLTQVKNLGPKTISKVMEFASEHNLNNLDENEIIDLLTELKKDNGRIKIPDISNVKDAKKSALRIMDQSDNQDIKIIGLKNQGYPKLLEHISNPPLLIHVKGEINALESHPTVAIVGTREPSNYGKILGERFSDLVAQNGFGIVSGLALGCDTVAHKAALRNNIPTIAVMAGGLHSIYPRENQGLAYDIVDNGGALISELPIGTNPFRSSFVQRDRIQSGLSLGTVIIQTDIKGGTMHTASFTLEQGRILACLIPDDSHAKHIKYQGNLKLVRENKAKAINSAEAVKKLFQELNNAYGEENSDKDKLMGHPPSGQLEIFN